MQEYGLAGFEGVKEQDGKGFIPQISGHVGSSLRDLSGNIKPRLRALGNSFVLLRFDYLPMDIPHPRLWCRNKQR